MDREAIIQLFTQRQEYWRQRDAVALAASHAEDAVVMSPIFGKVRGRDAIAASFRELFHVFPDWTMSADEVVIDGDRAVQVFSVSATHSKELFGVEGTGRRFEAQGVIFFRFEKGFIAFEQRFYDFTGMLIQLGVLKAKPRG